MPATTMLRAASRVVVVHVHPPEEHHPEREHERADDDVPAVAAGARDQLAR